MKDRQVTPNSKLHSVFILVPTIIVFCVIKRVLNERERECVCVCVCVCTACEK